MVTAHILAYAQWFQQLARNTDPTFAYRLALKGCPDTILFEWLKQFNPSNSIICFFQVNKPNIEFPVKLPKLLYDFLKCQNLVCYTSHSTEATLIIKDVRLNYWSAPTLKDFGICLSWQTTQCRSSLTRRVYLKIIFAVSGNILIYNYYFK